MGALFSYPAVVEDHDTIHLADRRQTMGNDQGGTMGEQVLQAFLDQGFSLAIHAGRCLVQDQNRGIMGQRSRQRQQLLLTHREIGPMLEYRRLEPLRQRIDETFGADQPGRLPHALAGDGATAQGQIML
jgi:hypothetical protein